MTLSAELFFELFSSKISNLKTRFIKSILENDLNKAKSIALDLYKENKPQFLVFYLYINLSEEKQLLLSMFRNSKVSDPSLFYLISISNDFNYDEIYKLSSKYKNDNITELCIQKSMLIRKTKNNIETMDYEIINLISKLDDFELYSCALDNKIDVPKSESINYKWYLVKKDKNLESFNYILRNSIDFFEIKNLFDISGIQPNQENHSILFDYFYSGYSFDLLFRFYQIYQNNINFLNLKIFLALLISSQKEDFLILAFYLSSDFYLNSNHKISEISELNYEIRLIHLFLNRYFLFHSNIREYIKKMDIKNIQMINLSYIWLDPLIITKRLNDNDSSGFLNEVSFEIKVTENNLKSFLEEDRIGHAVSLMSLRKRLMNSRVLAEVKEKRILSTTHQTMFSGLLGAHCSYLFDKITITSKRTIKGSINTIKSISDRKFGKVVFQNDIFPIADTKFIIHFEELYKTNHNL